MLHAVEFILCLREGRGGGGRGGGKEGRGGGREGEGRRVNMIKV